MLLTNRSENSRKHAHRQAIYLRGDAIFVETFSNLESVFKSIKINVLVSFEVKVI